MLEKRHSLTNSPSVWTTVHAVLEGPSAMGCRILQQGVGKIAFLFFFLTLVNASAELKGFLKQNGNIGFHPK